jgi:hypothetical protein
MTNRNFCDGHIHGKRTDTCTEVRCFLYFSLVRPQPAEVLCLGFLIAGESLRIAPRSRLSLWCAGMGELCSEAEDGREVVAKATQLQPDMIVLDFRMPISDGLQAASEICRTMPATRS